MGTYVTCIIFLVLTFAVTYYLGYPLQMWGAALVGLTAGIVIGTTSDYFTSGDKKPVMKTAESAKTGAATTIITGFSYGLQSVFPPLLGIGIAAAIAYFLCAPIGPGYEVIRITDELDAAGNTAKAITKGFAIGAAGLTVIALLAAFQEIASTAGFSVVFDIMNPLVLMGALIGVGMPALFSALLMLGVGRNAERRIAEIRRQFREIPGLREGKEGVKPDYAKCVDIATTGALRELLPASIITIVVTLAVGFVGGIQALGGYLVGSIFSGLLLALLMSNAGGLWDNAKKLI